MIGEPLDVTDHAGPKLIFSNLYPITHLWNIFEFGQPGAQLLRSWQKIDKKVPQKFSKKCDFDIVVYVFQRVKNDYELEKLK